MENIHNKYIKYTCPKCQMQYGLEKLNPKIGKCTKLIKGQKCNTPFPTNDERKELFKEQNKRSILEV